MTQRHEPNGSGPLRDARLQRALEHAPDAHMRPDAAVGQAILKAAHDAASQAADRPPAASWWAGWGGARGESGVKGRMPWNAAFATVLIATFSVSVKTISR